MAVDRGKDPSPSLREIIGIKFYERGGEGRQRVAAKLAARRVSFELSVAAFRDISIRRCDEGKFDGAARGASARRGRIIIKRTR